MTIAEEWQKQQNSCQVIDICEREKTRQSPSGQRSTIVTAMIVRASLGLGLRGLGLGGQTPEARSMSHE